MKVVVAGMGYVGLVTGLVLAEMGHEVVGMEKDKKKRELLRSGIPPFYEPHLEELLARHTEVVYPDEWGGWGACADVIIVSVGTPPLPQGGSDLSQVRALAQEIARAGIGKETVIINKSTVPMGTGGWLSREIHSHMKGQRFLPRVASCPEFLREGVAFYDAFYPDRIVIGADRPTTRAKVRMLFEKIEKQNFEPPPTLERATGKRGRVPVLETGLESAELIKYASNAFLATKISFINEVANICDAVGADIGEVSKGMGLDARIAGRFLRAGLGWGGSCFGKDVSSLSHQAAERGYVARLLQSAISVNAFQREKAVQKLAEGMGGVRGKRVTLLGISFKPGTSDLRDAPALTIAQKLIDRGALVTATDPVALPFAREEGVPFSLVACPYEAMEGADSVLLATEWPDYLDLDWDRIKKGMRGKLVLDGRNSLDRAVVEGAGLRYKGVGR